ncbi:hypothetical protein HY639_03620 [Candidatus Woesearchaeota archaeon]|nr:hypothetical protein [Candidatus Woesearchaeota archaeon]
MDYDQYIIRHFEYWTLYVHEQQYPYLGRSYAWAVRSDAHRIRDMLTFERNELFDLVIPSWEKAVAALFHPDWTNAAALGNTSPHLHWHLIPRYHSPRVYAGVTFEDPNPKGNYAPYPKKELPLEFVLQIRDQLKANL